MDNEVPQITSAQFLVIFFIRISVHMTFLFELQLMLLILDCTVPSTPFLRDNNSASVQFINSQSHSKVTKIQKIAGYLIHCHFQIKPTIWTKTAALKGKLFSAFVQFSKFRHLYFLYAFFDFKNIKCVKKNYYWYPNLRDNTKNEKSVYNSCHFCLSATQDEVVNIIGVSL